MQSVEENEKTGGCYMGNRNGVPVFPSRAGAFFNKRDRVADDVGMTTQHLMFAMDCSLIRMRDREG
jgi:hypothetical protein